MVKFRHLPGVVIFAEVTADFVCPLPSARREGGLVNTRQSLFASNYASCLNATKAALDAGYSSKTAYSQGQRLLKNVEVQQVFVGRGGTPTGS